jgi:putative membrane protein
MRVASNPEDAQPRRRLECPTEAGSLHGYAIVERAERAPRHPLIQYRQGLAYMWGPEFKAIAGEHTSPAATPVVAVCLVLALIGIFAFMAVLLRAV